MKPQMTQMTQMDGDRVVVEKPLPGFAHAFSLKFHGCHRLRVLSAKSASSAVSLFSPPLS
jgi:hypothetical protein